MQIESLIDVGEYVLDQFLSREQIPLNYLVATLVFLILEKIFFALPFPLSCNINSRGNATKNETNNCRSWLIKKIRGHSRI